MKSRFFAYSLSVFIFLLAQGICFGVNTQYWTGTSLSTKVNENIKLTFTEEFRLEEKLYRHSSDIGLVYLSLIENVDLGLNYKQIFKRDNDDEWRQENRPNLNLTVRGKLFGLDVSDRSRIEFRDRENKDNLWRYRNKFTINRLFEYLDSEALKKFIERYKPYVADEIFIDCDGNGYSRNRLYAGVIINLTENAACDLYYLCQSDEVDSSTKVTNVIGFNLIFNF